MEIVAAPGRVLKTFSIWIDFVIILISGAQIAAPLVGSLFDPKVFATIVAALSALSVFLKYVKQNIPVTPEQKVAIAEAAADMPVKKGQDDPGIAVTVANPPPAKDPQ